MEISNKKLFIDLKYFSSECHSLALNYEEMIDEFWKNDIFSDHGLPACIRISTVRRAIFRQLQKQKFFLLGSVFSMAFAQLTYRESLVVRLLTVEGNKKTPQAVYRKIKPQKTSTAKKDDDGLEE